ncbi:probable cell division cycle-associated 7-like protein at N-terminal half [Coccomyxa sp. Obi]|nr:probable cell division cycle-associated 7-like protein at N-terminal half [Coccomyxa sp. Obi]
MAPKTSAGAQKEGGEAPPKAVKKRTTDPGVRVQGGRIYDSKTGTTCHQCRQKTVEVKAKCGTCTMYFCPRCLLNRYGEEVDKVNQLPKWSCPKCRDICNCSNCRKKRGLEATGILANMSKAAGFTSVSDLLQKNPNAKRPPSASLQAPGAKAPKDATAPAAPKAQKKQKKAEPVEAAELIGDELLGARPNPMPERESVRIHRVPGEVSDVRWPPGVADRMDLPPDCSAGDLAEVLEFLKVFGEQTGTSSVSLSVLAVELLQPARTAGHSAYAREERSVAGHVHMRLLDLVRSDWGIKESVGIHGWQAVMKQYLRQDRLQGLSALDKLSGDASDGRATSSLAEDDDGEAGDQGIAAAVSPGAVAAAAGGAGGTEGVQSAVEDPLLAFPPGGYWALPAGARLRMLRCLCFDALETRTLREAMEAAMDAAAAEGKERREELAAAKREAREAWQKQRDREIALLLANGDGSGLTIEEQRALMEGSWAKMEATGAAAAGQVPACSGAAVAFPAAMRIVPLGSDRSGALFWKLSCCPVLAGAEGAVLMASEFRAAESDEWSVCRDAAALAAALDGRGRREAALLRAIEAGYGTAAPYAAKPGCASDAKLGAREGGNIGDARSAAAPKKAGAKSGAGATAAKAGKSRMAAEVSATDTAAAATEAASKVGCQRQPIQPATAVPTSAVRPGAKKSTAKPTIGSVPCGAAAAEKPKAGKKRTALEAATVDTNAAGRAASDAAKDPSSGAAVPAGTAATESGNKHQKRQALAEVQQSLVGTQPEQAPASGQFADLATLCNGGPGAASMSGKRQRKQKFDSLRF